MITNRLFPALYRNWFSDNKDQFFEIRHISHPDKHKKFWSNFYPGYTVPRQTPGFHLLFGINPRASRSGTAKAIDHAIAFWVDIDHPTDETIASLRSFRPSVSAVIASGVGLHCYWIIQPTDNLKVVPGILKGLASRLDGDPKCTDIARVFRVPGSINPKHNKPCREMFVDAKRVYKLEDFLPFQVEIEQKKNFLRPGSARELSVSEIAQRYGEIEGYQRIASAGLPKKFCMAVEKNETLAKIWNGISHHKSGSERDFALALWCCWRNYSPQEIAAIIESAPYEKHELRTTHYLWTTINEAAAAVTAEKEKEKRKGQHLQRFVAIVAQSEPQQSR